MTLPKIIGLTGNIGSGKSTIAQLFAMENWPVFNSDEAAKLLLKNNKSVIDSIVNNFGIEILDINKNIVNKKLADLVFQDENKLKILNNIVHPEVKLLFNNWLQKQNTAFIIRESALLFETGINTQSFKNIIVTCPIDERINRVLLRGGVTRNQILNREKQQMAEFEKVKLSDYIIVNYLQPVLPQFIKIRDEINTINQYKIIK